ncbi:MAG: IMP cyclohydrolase [Oscillospiraceae bacterium]|nr:IMP cyclohydrolase [Oscillospiraceae bacterium]
MELTTITNYLSGNTYPGRGVLIGKSDDGQNAVIAYFIMGRSENSRNRIFEPDGEGIRTRAFDESKLTDPSLIIYAPVRVLGTTTIVTNGDQTDTIYNYLKGGRTFEEALRSRTFEPDGPNFTPRISGEVIVEGGMSYKLSILKSDCGREEAALRYFYEYSDPMDGEGRLIHTYQCDGNPIPSFAGEPVRVKLEGDIDTFTKTVWDALDENNKVSLFTRYIDLKTGEAETRIINKNQ